MYRTGFEPRASNSAVSSSTARLEIKTSLADASDGLRRVMLAAVRGNEAVVRAQHDHGGGTIAAVNSLVSELGR